MASLYIIITTSLGFSVTEEYLMANYCSNYFPDIMTKQKRSKSKTRTSSFDEEEPLGTEFLC